MLKTYFLLPGDDHRAFGPGEGGSSPVFDLLSSLAGSPHPPTIINIEIKTIFEIGMGNRVERSEESWYMKMPLVLTM